MERQCLSVRVRKALSNCYLLLTFRINREKFTLQTVIEPCTFVFNNIRSVSSICLFVKVMPHQFMLFSIPAGWTRCVHPLGNAYYHKLHHGRVYITRNGITIPSIHYSILEQIDEVEPLISFRNDVPSNHILVFLELDYEGGADCGYFLVNNAPERRCIFFLHEMDVAKDPEVRDLDGPLDLGACQVMR